MGLLVAWLASSGGCFAVVQGFSSMAKSVTGGFNSRKLCHLGVLYDQNIQNVPLQWICVVQFCTFTSMTFSMQFVLLAAEITGGWSFSTASTAQFVILNAVESTGTIAGVPQHCMCTSLDPMCLPIAQGAGTVFVLTWPLYPAGMVEAIVASSVIWAATARFVLVGLKIFPDPQFASSMGAPHGQEHKLLQGPVQYGTVIALLTTFCFKSPSSVIPIGVLCGGDAIAALVGRRFGKQCLPWNNNKTVVGTTAFVVGAFSVTFALLWYMNTLDEGFKWLETRVLVQALTASVIGAAVETVPPVGSLENIDNLLIPASSVLVMLASSV